MQHRQEAKVEYRHRDEYRESFLLRQGLMHASSEVIIAICVIIAALMLLVWMFIQWWINDAWNTNPVGVIAVNTAIVALVGYAIWWNIKVKYDRHVVWKRRQLAEIGVLEVQPRIIEAQADKGFNTEIVEVEGTTVRTINPISIAPASNTTNNYLGASDEEGEEEEDEQKRPTIAELLPLVERNSFEVPLGTSLMGNGTVIISIEDVHVKIIGSSRKGKSCLAAAIIDLTTQTHDPHVLKIALLDLENKTSRLFEHMSEHIVVLPTVKGRLPMHARSVKQAAEYLHYIRCEMDRRYTLTDEELEKLPHILAYIEEFLSLKKHKDLSKEERATLADDLNELAIRGLKANIHLMACAQVDYADDDLKPFANNFGLNISFAVRPPAAQAAGFVCSEILALNWQSKTPGQCVVEGTGCNDLVIAPDYDVKAKLKALSSVSQGRNMTPQFTIAEVSETLSKHCRNTDRNMLEPALQAKLHQVMEYPGENMRDCIKRIWGAVPGDNEGWKTAKAEYEEILKMIHRLAIRGMEVEEV